MSTSKVPTVKPKTTGTVESKPLKTTDTPAETKSTPGVGPAPAAATPATTPADTTETILASVTITPAVTPTPAAVKGKQVKVKFLRSHPAFGYFAGDVAEISEEAFEQYSQDGDFFEKQK